MTPTPTPEQLAQAWQIVLTLDRLTTPYDSVDVDNQDAMDDAENEITNDMDAEDAKALRGLIFYARAIVAANT